MKKYFSIALAALALVAMTAACSKEKNVDESPASQTMTIKATISEAATRVTFDPSFDENFKPTAMAHTWQEGDKLRITDSSNSSNTAVFDLVDGAGTATGTFQGTGFDAASYDVEAIPVGTFNTSTEQTQAKDGATDHLQFVATATGVTDLEDFSLTETSGIIAVIAKLPAGVAGTINALEIEAKVPNYPISVKFTINLTEQEDVDSDDVLKLYANAPAGFVVPAGADGFLRFKSTNPAHTVYTRYQKFTTAIAPVAGKFNYIKMNCAHIDQYAGVEDDGMEENPYLIADKYQLQAMNSIIAEEDVISYFKLVSDIDMSGVTDWVPQNVTSPYDHGVNFDGAGHTISNFSCTDKTYAGFFGVLYGVCKNVNFTNATISQSLSSACGILAGYAGSGDMNAEISNVHVQGTVTMTGNKTGIGGLVGTVGNATIDACSADVVVNSGKNYVGGLFGYSKKVIVKNCWTAGSVTGDQRVGGICGGILGTGDSIINCYSIADLDGSAGFAAKRSVGGIVGHANLDKGDQNETRMPDNVVSGCIAWQSTINTRTYVGEVCGDSNDFYSSGAIVAFTATHNTLKDCYRRADLAFRDYADSFPLYDQENASPDTPLVVTPVEGCTHCYPYHGKAAESGKTLSEVAKSLGWSSDVWDFSGELPTLK